MPRALPTYLVQLESFISTAPVSNVIKALYFCIKKLSNKPDGKELYLKNNRKMIADFISK